MLRTLCRFSIIGLSWCTPGAAASPAESDEHEAPIGVAPKPAAGEDPCVGYDLTTIRGLRGTIISRVYPAQFSQGDQVTVCGRGLSMARFIENYQPEAGGPLQAGSFVEIGDETNKRGWRLRVHGVSVAPNGDRIRFVAGSLFEGVFHRSSVGSSYFLVPAGRPGLRPAQSIAKGELKFVLGATQFGPPKVVGPSVTWFVGGPKPRHAYGRFFNKKEPFVITAQRPDDVTSDGLSLVTIDGGNLRGATFHMGNTLLKTVNVPGDDGTSVVALVPQNAPPGEICATGSGERKCVGNIAVQPGPAVTTMPPMPLQLRTRYTIEGTDLKPSVPGLTYHLVMTGLTGDAACAQLLKVTEHTARQIQFGLGEVGDTSPLPATCSRAANYQSPQENPSNLILLMARYKGQEKPLFQIHYYLGQRKPE